MVTDESVATVPTTSLHPSELERSKRYYRHQDRLRFTYGRHLLRTLLARYTHQSADQVVFTLGKNGKPEPANALGWHVNVSHAGAWVVVVVAQAPVGIDVETFEATFAFDSILPVSFSEAEQQAIRASAAPASTFFDLWTRKEAWPLPTLPSAWVKATGQGLDDAFPDVPSLAGSHRLAYADWGVAGDWQVQSFTVAASNPAAVAYPTHLGTPNFYTVDGGFFLDFTS